MTLLWYSQKQAGSLNTHGLICLPSSVLFFKVIKNPAVDFALWKPDAASSLCLCLNVLRFFFVVVFFKKFFFKGCTRYIPNQSKCHAWLWSMKSTFLSGCCAWALCRSVWCMCLRLGDSETEPSTAFRAKARGGHLLIIRAARVLTCSRIEQASYESAVPWFQYTLGKVCNGEITLSVRNSLWNLIL